MNGGKIFLTLQENDDCIKKQTDNLSVCFCMNVIAIL